jgi:transcriptional regulator with XRE-family HTH domain
MVMTSAQLKDIRERRGWSQDHMAAEVGVSRVLLGQMERGQAPIEPRTEHLVNRMREFMVDLRDLESDARHDFSRLSERFASAVPGGNSAELVGLRVVETGEIMGICRLSLPISGDDEEQRSQVENIIKERVPAAICQIWDYQHKYRCGLVTDEGRKIEVSFVRRGISDVDVRIQADKLAQLIDNARATAN